ncbi:MAG: FmdE family protein [Acidimicrobiales bacterium]
MCPGLAMGVQASQIALREIGPHSKDEEVVAMVETDMCAVDAVQYMTGCTFGKGNLIHRDWGKNAYTFFRRSDGKAIRVAGRVGAWQREPEHEALFARVRSGQATEEERERFTELHQAASVRILETAPEELFTVDPVDTPLPHEARIHASVVCDRCGEEMMETRAHLLNGRTLCEPCSEAELVDAR